MRDFLTYIQDVNMVSVLCRLGFSLLAGIVIGIDRARKRRGAGIKTHVLVCMGSALVMLTAQYVCEVFDASKIDITRMGAQVISGVGFLGVGTIVVTGRNQVRGLTTAAGLWACACLGLAAGIGFWDGAIVMLVLVVITFGVLAKLDQYVTHHSKVLDLYVEVDSLMHASEFLKTVRTMNVRVNNFEINKTKIKNDFVTALITVEMNHSGDREKVLSICREMEGVLYLEEI